MQSAETWANDRPKELLFAGHLPSAGVNAMHANIKRSIRLVTRAITLPSFLRRRIGASPVVNIRAHHRRGGLHRVRAGPSAGHSWLSPLRHGYPTTPSSCGDHSRPSRVGTAVHGG